MRRMRIRWVGGDSGNEALQYRARQNEDEVYDLQRIESSLGQSLETVGMDYEGALPQYQNLLGTEPLRTPGGARVHIQTMRKLQDEARKQQRGRVQGDLYDQVLSEWKTRQQDDAAAGRTPAPLNGMLFMGALAEADRRAGGGHFTPQELTAYGTLAGQGRILNWQNGIATYFDPATNEWYRVGTDFMKQGEGMPATELVPGRRVGDPSRVRPLPGPFIPGQAPIVEWPEPGTPIGPEAAPGRAPAGLPEPGAGVQHGTERPIMPPGLEIAAPDQPINLRRPGIPEPMGERPIDLRRPVIPGLPGPMGPGPGAATEETITIDMGNGQHFLLPTIVDGQRVTPQQAVALYRMGRNDPVGVYGGEAEAESAAQARSQRIGQVRGLGGPGAPGAPPPGAPPAVPTAAQQGFRTLYQPPTPPGEIAPEDMDLESITTEGGKTTRRYTTSTQKLSQPVQDVLRGMNIDPRKASGDQIKAAREILATEAERLAGTKLRTDIQTRQELEPGKMLGPAHKEYYNAATGKVLTPDQSYKDAGSGMRTGTVVNLPDQADRDWLNQSKARIATLMRMRNAIVQSNAVFPYVDSGNLAGANLQVWGAKVQEILRKDIDSELGWMFRRGKLEALGINKEAGDKGQQSNQDREAGLEALGTRATAKEVALANVDSLISNYRNRIKDWGFNTDNIVGKDDRKPPVVVGADGRKRYLLPNGKYSTEVPR